MINGQPAARSWWTGSENGGDSAFTAVRVSATETAYINSFYGPGSEGIEDTVIAIHNSFRVIDPR